MALIFKYEIKQLITSIEHSLLKKKTDLTSCSFWQVPDLFPIEEACGGPP